MKRDSVGTAMMAAAAANVIWGFGAMFSRIGLSVATPSVLMTWRFCVAFLVMRLIALFRGIDLKVFGRSWKKLLLMALFEPVMYFAFEQYGIMVTSATFAGLILSMGPIGTMIMGALFLKEKPSLLQVLFCLVSVSGVVLLSASPGSGDIFSLLGTILLVCAILSGSAYITVNRSLANSFSPFERTYSMTVFGLVFFFIWALIENRHAPAGVFVSLGEMRFLLSAVYLGAFSTVTSYVLISYAANYLSVARIAAFNNIYTIVAALAGILFLREPFFPMLIPCAFVILLGVWGVQRFALRE